MRLVITVTVILLAVACKINAQCPASITTVKGSRAPTGTICQNQLLLNEEFNNFDLGLWNHELSLWGGGNGEFQWYVDDRANTYVEDGKLYIRPTLTVDYHPNLFDCAIVIEGCTTEPNGCEHRCSPVAPLNPIRSGKVISRDTFAFKFGRLEVLARNPTGDWFWPAIWLMPQDEVYGGWPRSGEIDLMESKGNTRLFNNEGVNIGNEEFGSTLHFGTAWYNSAWWSSNFAARSPPGRGWDTDFHLYGMEWTPNYIRFSIDNRQFGEIPVGEGFFRRGLFPESEENPWVDGTLMAPFDKEFYIQFNLAIGGSNGFFPDSGNEGGKPWSNGIAPQMVDFWNNRNMWLPTWNLNVNNAKDASLVIDHVRVYAL